MSDLNKMGMFQSIPGEYEAYLESQKEACPVTGIAADFKPFSDDYLQNPYLFFDRIRAEEPIFYSPQYDYWVVSKYEDITAVFKDPDTFSPANARHPVKPVCPRAVAVREQQNIQIEPSLVDEDSSTHKKHRRIFGDAFTPKRVREMEDRIREIVDRYIDQFVNEGQADLVSQMLYEIPALAIFIFLGAADEDAAFVKRLGADRAIVNFGNPDEAQQIAMMHGMGEHWQFTERLVHRTLENPGDNYMGDMARLHHEDPTRFTVNYLTNVAFLMQFAGHETTTQAMANGLKHLLQNREQWERLCAEPALIPNAVEEILRIDGSIFAWRRIATKEVEVGGQIVPKGGRLLLLLGSGNHDEEMFPNGAKIDVTRKNAKRHLSLGMGAHFCMGAPLARLEMRIMLEQLTKRLPNIRLVENQEWEYLPTLIFRGVQKLHVVWD